MADRRPRAALCVAATLVALPYWSATPGTRPCPAPSERAHRAGHSSEVGCAGGRPLRGPARLLFGLRLDPNTADAAALEVLPGLGASRAQAVVAARCAQPFRSLRDLERVRGIGPRTRADLEPWLEVAPFATLGTSGKPGDVPGRESCGLPGTSGAGEPPSTTGRSTNVP